MLHYTSRKQPKFARDTFHVVGAYGRIAHAFCINIHGMMYIYTEGRFRLQFTRAF